MFSFRLAGGIVALDAESMTIQLRSGGVGQAAQNVSSESGSKIVFFGSETSVLKTVDGGVTDLAVGGQVTVTGTPNSDGSVTAQSIQLRPTRSASPL